MKSIRSKLYFVYLLMAVALTATIISSYVAIDTNHQHLLLTGLLGEQRLHVEKLVLLTDEAIELRALDESLYQEKRKSRIASVHNSIDAVDNVLNDLTLRETLFLDKRVPLKFEGEFEIVLEDALEASINNWVSSKDEIEVIFSEEKTSDYDQRVHDFQMMNHVLIDDVDKISKLCQNAAEKQRIIANTLQGISIGVVGIIFIWLMIFMRKDFQRPILKIRNVFKKMSLGDYNVTLSRRQEDEFNELFSDFNRFIENKHLITHIEDHILSENKLRTVLKEMMEDFKSFVELDQIQVTHKDSFNQIMRIGTRGENVALDQLEKYESIFCTDQMTLVMPIAVNDIYLGYASFLKTSPFTEKELGFVSGLENKIGFAFYKSLIFKDLLSIVTTGLADLTESRDPETKRHLDRMSLYAQIIAKYLLEQNIEPAIVDEEFVDNILLAAPMHDIGKVAVPDHILLKPGKLTLEEFEEMKKHTCEGARVLKGIHQRFMTYNVQYFKMAEDIAHFHQEKFDGSGYPEGVSGRDIPLAARISTVADVFDALTNKRPYKEAFPLERSYNIIRESSGSHFDPDLVEAFFACQTEIEKVYYQYREI